MEINIKGGCFFYPSVLQLLIGDDTFCLCLSVAYQTISISCWWWWGCILRFSLNIQQVTIVTSQPGRHLVRQLERGLKDADLVLLKRLLVVQIELAGDWGEDSPVCETHESESEGQK